MLELDRKVFGSITTKEIIGADPPAVPDMRDRLESELAGMLSGLDGATKQSLEGLLELRGLSDAHVNSRPGAMALAQDKIQMYNRYSQRYADAVRKRLES